MRSYFTMLAFAVAASSAAAQSFTLQFSGEQWEHLIAGTPSLSYQGCSADAVVSILDAGDLFQTNTESAPLALYALPAAEIVLIGLSENMTCEQLIQATRASTSEAAPLQVAEQRTW